MVGYIYLITDTTNGMKYTGKHHYHIEGQLDSNYHGSGTIIKNIYKKRPETLKEEYIKTCYSEEEMCSDEQYYIKLFKTLWPNGYNLTEGGDGWSGGPCEETRRKLSEIRKKLYSSGVKHPMLGKHHSEETKKKMSVNRSGKCIGENHPMFGKHHTEEAKMKMSAVHKGKHPTEETKKKMSNAHKGKPKEKPMSEETKKKLSDALKGRTSPNKGKHLSEETKKKISNAHKGKPKEKLSKKVLQYTLDGEFVREWPSIAECERNGFNHSKICLCCQGKRKSHKGFKWCYA